MYKEVSMSIKKNRYKIFNFGLRIGILILSFIIALLGSGLALLGMVIMNLSLIV